MNTTTSVRIATLTCPLLFAIVFLTGCSTAYNSVNPEIPEKTSGWEKIEGKRPTYTYKYCCGDTTIEVRDLMVSREYILFDMYRSFPRDTSIHAIIPSDTAIPTVVLKDPANGKEYPPVSKEDLSRSFGALDRLDLYHRNFYLGGSSNIYTFPVPEGDPDSVQICMLQEKSRCNIPPLTYKRLTFGLQSGTGILTSIQRNEIAPAFFYEMAFKRGGIQMNLATFTVIPCDPYNDNKTSVSLFPLYGIIPVLVGGCFKDDNEEWFNLLPDSGALRPILKGIGTALVASYVLPNMQIHYTIFSHKSKKGMGGFASSVFVGSRLDMYTSLDTPWMRFAPNAGLELFTQLSRQSVSTLPPPAIALQAGATKHWDIGNDFNYIEPWSDYLAVKYYFSI